MESVAIEDQIIVSPSTKLQIQDEFNFKLVPIKESIKGFETLSECFEVISKKKKSAAFNSRYNKQVY